MRDSHKLLEIIAEPHFDDVKIGSEKLRLLEIIDTHLKQYNHAKSRIETAEAGLKLLQEDPKRFFQWQRFFQ
jgi:hypothetical protein